MDPFNLTASAHRYLTSTTGRPPSSAKEIPASRQPSDSTQQLTAPIDYSRHFQAITDALTNWLERHTPGEGVSVADYSLMEFVGGKLTAASSEGRSLREVGLTLTSREKALIRLAMEDKVLQPEDPGNKVVPNLTGASTPSAVGESEVHEAALNQIDPEGNFSGLNVNVLGIRFKIGLR